MRVLSRIMTLILADILDKSAMSELVVNLQEVAEIVTAPKLTRYRMIILLRKSHFLKFKT